MPTALPMLADPTPAPVDQAEIDRVLLTARWWVINTSAGKDSQTMMRAAVGHADRLGVPRERLVAVHADLGDVEWPGVVELAREQAQHYGLTFCTCTARDAEGEEIGLLEQIIKRGRWPSRGARYCTSRHKVTPIGREITRLVNSVPGYQGGKLAKGLKPLVVVNVLGMRAEESPERAKLRNWTIDGEATNGKRIVHRWLPIHDWTKERVWDDIRASGVRHHWAYDLGMPRLSCMFCVFSPRKALLLAGRQNPQLLRDYVDAERKMGHTFKHGFSLSEVLAEIEADPTPAAPVAVDDWAM